MMTPERWQRLEHLLHEAEGLASDEREAYLQRACHDDPALLQEARALLAGLDESGPFDRLVEQGLPGLAVSWAPAPAEQSIGPYRTLSVIGQGGMGTVYLAERADEQFRQRVALKLINPGLRGAHGLRRFLHERQILARLEHPHIARLLDGGMTPHGQPYFAMEYVDGRPIDRFCDEQLLSVADRIRLFMQVCEAVQFAHRNLIVHRDLKPSNMLVTGGGQVKLLDFGIAKLLAESEAEELTRTQHPLMTPEYASPEQVRGGPITTASDVYALGVVLYELLTGQRPYTLEDCTPGEVERIVCETEPQRPSTVVRRLAEVATTRPVNASRRTRLQRLHRRLTGDLDTIVMKALHKDPARRYASAGHLAEDLRRHLEGQPVEARPDTVGYRAAKFVQRHRIGVAMAAAFVALLVAGVVATAWQAQRATEQARIAQIEQAHAQAAAAKAQAVSDFVIDLFQVADPEQAQGETVTARALLERGAAQVRAGLAAQPEVQATMLVVMGQVYRNLGLYAAAESLLVESVALRRQHLGTDALELAESYDELAEVRMRRNDLTGADTLVAAAFAIRQAHPEATPAMLASSYNHLAAMAQLHGAYERADSLYRLELAVRRAAGEGGWLSEAVVLGSLASIQHTLGRYATADSLFQRVLAIQRDSLGPLHPDVSLTLNNLALVHYAQNDYDAAAGYLRESLAIRRQILPPDHPDLAMSVSNMAAVLEKQGNIDEAEAMYREALALKRRALGEQHPSVAVTLNNLALLRQAQGDLEEAEALLLESKAIRVAQLGPNHPDVATANHNLGKLYFDRKEWAAALQAYEAAYRLRREVLGPRHPRTALSASGMARALSEQGRHEEAVALLEEAVSIFEATRPADDPILHQARDALATERRLFEQAGAAGPVSNTSIPHTP